MQLLKKKINGTKQKSNLKEVIDNYDSKIERTKFLVIRE